MHYKYIFVVVAIVMLPLTAGATYNDVSLTTDTVLTIGSYTINVSGSTATIESIVVGTTNFVVTMPESSSLKIKSPTKNIMEVAGLGSEFFTTTCDSTGNLMTISSIPTGKGTKVVTITPVSTICSTPTDATTATGSTAGSGGRVSSVSNIVTQPAITPSTGVATAVQAIFVSDLYRGITNSDVNRLQQLLARDATIYPEGLVTGFFGPATERAVKRFQAKYGISQIGRVGPATRAKLATVFSTTATTPVATPTSTVAPSPTVSKTTTQISAVFANYMSVGDNGPDVKRLQQLLNTDVDTRIASEGVGSPGNETTIFGTLTEKAVQKFQVKYGLAKEGDSGYGSVGPLTRAMLLEVFGAR